MFFLSRRFLTKQLDYLFDLLGCLVVERRICGFWRFRNTNSDRMTSNTDEESKADAFKRLANGDSCTGEVKPNSEKVGGSTEVKEEPLVETDDINVFGDDDSKDDQDWVAPQETIKEVN